LKGKNALLTFFTWRNVKQGGVGTMGALSVLAQSEQINANALATDWDAAIDNFLFDCRTKNLSPWTVHSYNDRLKQFAKFARERGETPATFNFWTVKAFVAFQQEKGIKAPTTNGYLRTLSVFVNFLIREGVRDDNPLKGFPRLKEGLYPPRTLSDDQIAALLSACDDTTFLGLRNLALISLFLDTGLRLSEALQLTVEDALNALQTGMITVVGKGNKQRSIPIGYTTAKILQRYLVARKKLPTQVDNLWVAEDGTPLQSQGVRLAIARLGKKAGIKGVRVSPHSLRFTFVRRWLQSGGDSIVLQRFLGHSTIAMTSYYAQLFPSDLKTAHARFSPMETLGALILRRRKRVTLPKQ
jgi:integrase/recombinase XerD